MDSIEFLKRSRWHSGEIGTSRLNSNLVTHHFYGIILTESTEWEIANFFFAIGWTIKKDITTNYQYEVETEWIKFSISNQMVSEEESIKDIPRELLLSGQMDVNRFDQLIKTFNSLNKEFQLECRDYERLLRDYSTNSAPQNPFRT